MCTQVTLLCLSSSLSPSSPLLLHLGPLRRRQRRRRTFLPSSLLSLARPKTRGPKGPLSFGDLFLPLFRPGGVHPFSLAPPLFRVSRPRSQPRGEKGGRQNAMQTRHSSLSSSSSSTCFSLPLSVPPHSSLSVTPFHRAVREPSQSLLAALVRAFSRSSFFRQPRVVRPVLAG